MAPPSAPEDPASAAPTSSGGAPTAVIEPDELLVAVLVVQLGLASAAEVTAAAGRGEGRLTDRLDDAGLLRGDRRTQLERAVAAARAASAAPGPTVVLESFGGEGDTASSEVPMEAEVAADRRARLESFGGPLLKPAMAPAGAGTLPAVEGGEVVGAEEPSVTPEAPGRYRWHDEHGAPVDVATGAELGRGGIGRVLRAWDEHLGREVAIKELLAGAQGSEAPPSYDTGKSNASAVVARFLREARVTGQLEHPGITPVYEVGRRDDGTLYYAMRLVRGRTLGEVLAEQPTVPGRLRALSHFVDVCQAVAYAHSRGVVHRDIKPENIMVGAYGETVLLDWGLAKVRGLEDIRERALARDLAVLLTKDVGRTMQGHAIGTPAYMSPEQAEGHVDEIDERSDVWSLGAVLYELLTGQPPYAGATPYEVIGRVIRGPPPPPQSICPEVPGELAAICQKALSHEPAQRYRTAMELAEEIESYQSGGPVAAYNYSRVEVLKRFVHSYRVPLATLGVALVVLVGVAGLAYSRVVEERDLAVAAKAQAREHLTAAFVEKASGALREGATAESELYAAAALSVAEEPTARGLFARLDPSQAASLRWQRRLSPRGCDDVAFVGPERVACVGADAVVFFDATDGSEVRRFATGPGLRALRADGQRLATASSEAFVELWDPTTAERRGELRSGRSELTALAFLGDGRWLATGDDVGVVRVWDAESGAELLALEGHEGAVAAVTASADGGLLAVATEEGPSRLWRLVEHDVPGGEEDVSYPDEEDAADAGPIADGEPAVTRRPLVAHPAGSVAAGGVAAALSADGRRLALALAEPPSVLVYDVGTGRELGQLDGHHGRIRSVVFQGEETDTLATGSDDGTARVWHLGQRGSRLVLGGNLGPAASVAFAPGAEAVAVADPVAGLRLWSLPAAQGPAAFRAPGAVTALAVAPKGQRFAVATSDRQVHVYAADTQRREHRLRLTARVPKGTPAHEVEIAHLTFRGDGGMLIAHSLTAAQAWSLPDGRAVGVLAPPAGRVGGAGFDKAGEPVVWGTERAESGEVTARWWRLGEREARAFPVLGKGTDPLALLAGLDAYATGDEEGGVSLRDLTTGEVRWHVAGPGEPVLRLLVAAEGAVLVAQDAARSLTVIDIEEGHVRGAVRQPGTELVEVAATPAGPWLVGVDRDEEVRVYRLPARGEVGEGNPPDLAAGQAHLLARWAAEDSGAALALAGPDELWTAGRDRRLRRHGLGALSRPGPELLQDAERRYGVRFDGSRLVPRWPDPAP